MLTSTCLAFSFPHLPISSASTHLCAQNNFFGTRFQPKCKRRARKHTTPYWVCALPNRLCKIANEIANERNLASRYIKLAELGDTIECIPEQHLTAETRVPGCVSITHVQVNLIAFNTLQLRGYSDARISRGLLALFVLGLDGCPCEDALNLDANELIEILNLHGVASPTRLNGIANLARQIQTQVNKLLQITKSNVSEQNIHEHSLTGRWSKRQGEDVAVLLSGGVDSSVAMRLVMESGATPHPFYLKIWLDDELAHLGECPWEEDIEYANAVCRQAGVQLRDVPFQTEYWNEVVSYTVREAQEGRTPNPDIMCNSRIKFGAFYDRIGKYYDRVVTGHYASTKRDESGCVELRLSKDKQKDQTYFLAHLRQEQLAHASFPLGDFTKDEVRELARKYDLRNKNRRDSQGICFLGKLKFDEFLGHHLGKRRGSLVEYESGEDLGYHNGFWFYTPGQRRGIRLSGGPWYVVWKDVSRNIVYVSKDYHNISKERNCFEFDGVSWIAGKWPPALQEVGTTSEMRVKTRHGPAFHEAIITKMSSTGGRVLLSDRDKGLAAGQFCVFYDFEGRCLGSGIVSIDRSLTDGRVVGPRTTLSELSVSGAETEVKHKN